MTSSKGQAEHRGCHSDLAGRPVPALLCPGVRAFPSDVNASESGAGTCGRGPARPRHTPDHPDGDVARAGLRS